MLQDDQIPMAMALAAVEKADARYRCTRQAIPGPNQLGWKIAHIDDVGLGYTGSLETLSLNKIVDHMKRFLSPGNMFLVPKEYGGVAETPEFLAIFRERAVQEPESRLPERGYRDGSPPPRTPTVG